MSTPPRKNTTGLIVGVLVGVLLSAGGGVAALVLTRDGSGSPPQAGSGQTTKVEEQPPANGARAVAENFVAAYNKAVESDTNENIRAPEEFVCYRLRGEIFSALLNNYTKTYQPRLAVSEVTEEPAHASVVLTVEVREHSETLELSVNQEDGPWRLCDLRLRGKGSGVPFPGVTG